MEQDVYVSTLAKEVGVTPDSIRHQIRKHSRSKYNKRQKDNFRKLQSDLNGRNDKINTERYKKQRVTTAEEGVIAYLVKNQDKLSYISSQLDENKFQTEFNRKLYSYFSERIKNGDDALMSVSGDFTPEETAKIFRIINSDFAKMANDETLRENIGVINDEYARLKLSDISSASDEDIQERLRRLRDNRK